ncbi:hypothetical protein RCL_jg5788.t1 [Rhizophagus clarus]|uniref:Uncharacterized protein n=1 Tax=Rhizophagus clarus TaxID=94130 RepID=A0A8H3M061_9GLOM|nr:hypothetical protein RCL_jg5788.t1 [Rhizophagus clarus]
MDEAVIEEVAVADISVKSSYLGDNLIGETMMEVDLIGGQSVKIGYLNLDNNHNSVVSTVDNLVELSEFFCSDIFKVELVSGTNTSQANNFYGILSNSEMPSYPNSYNPNNYVSYNNSFVGTNNLVYYMQNLNLYK